MSVSRIWASAICALVVCGAARADDIKVMSPVALKPVIEAVRADFERANGHKLALTWAESGAIAADLEKGIAFDVAIITPNFVKGLAEKARIDGAAVTPVARSGLGIAIRKGAPKPDVSTVDAFKRTLLNAKSIGVAEHSASGRYLAGLLPRLGIADAIKDKLKPLPGAVYPYVAKGDVEIAITQIAAVVPFPEIELAGPFPADIQNYTTFVAVLPPNATTGARALLTTLASPGTAAILSKSGLEAPTR
jgi:molybdate transport system substrate-binding protein